MRIEGGSLRFGGELSLELAGAGAAAGATRPAAASSGTRPTLVERMSHVLTESAAKPKPTLFDMARDLVTRASTGYAPETPPAAPPTTPSTSTSRTTVTSPLDFLRDSRLSAEEKLVLLLAQQQKDLEKEIDTVLKKAEAKSATKTKSTGGLLGGLKVLDVVKSAIPALGLVESAFGEGAIEKAIQQLGGPALAAAATALGAPELAPLAMSLGPDLIGGALDLELPFAGGATAQPKAVNAPNAGTGSSTALDPVEVQRLTLLVNRQQQWATTVSNLLHAQHQTRMNVIQNIR